MARPTTKNVVDFQRPVHALLGLPFDAVTMDETVAALEQRVRAGDLPPVILATPNVNFVASAGKDAAFRDTILATHMSVADGMPLVWVSRLLGLPIRHRVAGAGVFDVLAAKPASKPIKVFFFGGPDGAADAASRALNDSSRYPGMRGVGGLSPGFGSVDAMSSPATLDAINASGADFLVVALGAAKGHAWIQRNAAQLNMPLVSHLGAVVNFVAGTIKRAPAWAQAAGFEWAWRIAEEPALKKRYWNDGVNLLKLLVRRVLPLLVLQRLRPPPARELARAAVQIEHPANGVNGVTLRLHGAWCNANLRPLRDALTAAVVNPAAVTVDLTDVAHLDSAAIALLMLLRGHMTEAGLALQVTGASRALRRLLGLHLADYLLTDPA